MRKREIIFNGSNGEFFYFDKHEIEMQINESISLCHNASKSRGWWHDIQTGEPLKRNIGEMLCLIHSEISEAMEGHRSNKSDKHLPQFKSIEVELADALIRIFDLAGGLGLNLACAFTEKIEYNLIRDDHSLESRCAEDGKKF